MEAKKHKLACYNKAVISGAKPGDQLKFPRMLYSHWAVYIGKEEVVHLAGIEECDGLNGNFNPKHVFTISGYIFNKAVVKRESVWNVVLDSKIKINNNKDKSFRPFGRIQIANKAISMVGEIGYNALWRNCEHFAAYCRYGVAWSKQADAALMILVMIFLLVILFAVYKLCRRRWLSR